MGRRGGMVRGRVRIYATEEFHGKGRGDGRGRGWWREGRVRERGGREV